MLLKRLLQRMQRVALRQASTVISSAPSACTASMRQERTVAPLYRIVQAPDAMFAAEMRAGEVQLLAQEIGQSCVRGPCARRPYR